MGRVHNVKPQVGDYESQPPTRVLLSNDSVKEGNRSAM